MSAILSPCGLYRFELRRNIRNWGLRVALIGVNPSTADALKNDATIRKDMGFAMINGWRVIVKGNVFPFRATDVRALAHVADHRLEENDEHLRRIAAEVDMIVPCWGDRKKVPMPLRHRFDFTRELLRETGKPIYTFGFTKSGDPIHPLMLSYKTPLVPWFNTMEIPNADLF